MPRRKRPTPPGSSSAAEVMAPLRPGVRPAARLSPSARAAERLFGGGPSTTTLTLAESINATLDQILASTGG